MSKNKLPRPKGWKQGRTPKFKEHPSVVRYRDPEVRSALGVEFLDGKTHARFVADPNCCDVCKFWHEKVHRIKTVLNFVYLLPHPNAIDCYWEGGYMKNGEFVYELED